jgi:uncharacterized integral membrane protein (TIGR00698 family)
MNTASQIASVPVPAPHGWPAHALEIFPGLALCIGVTGAAEGLQALETRLFGNAWLESLVLAILIGTLVRTLWTPGPIWRRGIDFSAKFLLETAVVLLGASVSAAMTASAGASFLFGIAGVVIMTIAASYGIGRLVGLKRRMAILIACGNSICGNSAIAAVAPVIGADSDDVATSIAFTAVLGVLTVLGLPLIGEVLHMSALQYGALAGLTVYAVPQVIAAAAPMGAVAIQIGTLVKLIRVLMLGPICLALSIGTSSLREETDAGEPTVAAGDRPKAGLPPLHRLVPWFILGFLAMVGLRSAGAIPAACLSQIAVTASLLTVVSMAALGLGVDIRVVVKAGPRVIFTVTASLVALGVIACALIKALNLA